MILEVAILNVKGGVQLEFEQNLEKAHHILAAQKGYISHELKKCIEVANQYILLVHWKTIENHEIDFRKSPDYQDWKQLLHHFYEPFPEVLHYS